MKLTRQKYLKKIQDCIMALPLEEQKEVMDYYTNYFEDAGDDEKVIEEWQIISDTDMLKVTMALLLRYLVTNWMVVG